MNSLIKIILSISAASAFFAGEAETPKKSDAELLYEKILAENTKDADKQYGEYLAALAKANDAVVKKLEAAKADYNNMKKFPKLDITERAKAIAEIDAKIEEVKKNGVGEAIVAKADAAKDLMGDGKVDLAKAIVGKWETKDKKEWWIFSENNVSSVFTNGAIKNYSIANDIVESISVSYSKTNPKATFRIVNETLVRNIEGIEVVLYKSR